MAVTGWASWYKSASIALTVSNTVATCGVATGNVRADRAMNPNLVYFELVATTVPSTTISLGICALMGPGQSVNNLPGADNTALGYRQNGTVVRNNVTLTTIAAYVSGDNIGIAVDQINQKVWFRVNGGNWNNDVIANQDPANNLGGISYASMAFGALTSTCGFTVTSGSGVCTAKWASASWTYTAPTGFVSPDTTNSVVAASSPNFKAVENGILSAAMPTSFGAAEHSGKNTMGGVNRQFSPPSTATVNGIVKENGVAIANKVVRLYDATTGEFLAEVKTDGAGAFSFPGFGKPSVQVIARDNPTYDAQIHDSIIPG